MCSLSIDDEYDIFIFLFHFWMNKIFKSKIGLKQELNGTKKCEIFNPTLKVVHEFVYSVNGYVCSEWLCLFWPNGCFCSKITHFQTNGCVCSANRCVCSEWLCPFQQNGCDLFGDNLFRSNGCVVRRTDVAGRNDCARSNWTDVPIWNGCAYSDWTDVYVWKASSKFLYKR